MLLKVWLIIYYLYMGFYFGWIVNQDTLSATNAGILVFNTVLFAWNIKLDIQNYLLDQEIKKL